MDTYDLDAMEASIFGARTAAPPVLGFELSFASQGAEALEKVRQARDVAAPYALAFVDMRMPPGWDGLETLTHLWAEDPTLQAVICSAYSDHSWAEITAKLGVTDRFLILKKPFDPVEVRQIACALTEKWNQAERSAHAEADLRRSEAKNRGILTALPDALLVVTRDGTCRDFKPARGAAATALVFRPGEPISAVLGEELGAQMAERVGLAIDTGNAQIFELRREKEGGARHFEARIAGIDAEDALVLLRDITEDRQRDAAMKEHRARENALRAQAETLLSISTPLIPITDDIVVMPLVGELEPSRMLHAQETLLQGIVARGARTAILDLTGVPRVTPEIADEIVRIAQSARLLGAEIMLTGIRPEVAQTLVNLGQGFSGLSTQRTLQSGIAFAMGRR
ncbi:response regulator [Polyangium sp. y55x31]|uniref:response regulator n=1 Tax=Polyangium sp. y55x31 TaxID=3042688 RepID=UPI0024830C4C|nr:response regulator [Polyangium sp. y55x31]MDI1476472.1 response regulator [Polyangium sp. y55x31]